MVSILDAERDMGSWVVTSKHMLECLSLVLRSWITKMRNARFKTRADRTEAIRGFKTRAEMLQIIYRIYRCVRRWVGVGIIMFVGRDEVCFLRVNQIYDPSLVRSSSTPQE